MKQPLIFSLGLFFLSVTGSVAAQNTPIVPDTVGSTLSLQQAVNIAIKNNLAVNQADLQMQGSRVSLNQAWDNMLPTVNGSATQNIGFGRTLNTYDYTYVNQVNSGSYGLNGNLNLFSGLQVQNSIRQNKYAYAASKLDLQQQKDNITLSVILAYLQVLSNRDLLAIAIEQARIDSIQVDRLDILNREGALLLLSNLTDLKGQYAGDEANIAITINNLESAKINLFQLLNVPYKRDVELEQGALTMQMPDNTADPDNIYQSSLHLIPSIRSADLRVHAYEKALLVAKGQYYPTLSFYGGITTNYYSLAYNQIPTTISSGLATSYYFTQGGQQVSILATKQNYDNEKISFGDQFRDNKATSIGFQLNIPILNYLHVRNNVKQARINLRNAQLNENATRLGLQQNVEQAFQNMISAYKQYKFYIDQAAAYAESFRTTQIRFNEGVITSDVYIQAKNRTDMANTSLSAAKYTYIFRTKVLDYYQGKLNW